MRAAGWMWCGLVSLGCTAGLAQTVAVPAQGVQRLSGSGEAGWVLRYREDFEEGRAPFASAAPAWAVDAWQNTDAWADGGSYFRQQGIEPPVAFRAEASFGTEGWLRVAAYSRLGSTRFRDLFQVVPDPANPANHVLKLASPLHTDGIVIGPSAPLPAKYRVCVKVGFADFGDGRPGGLNGYLGGETAGPWLKASAVEENGFYWLTLVDAVPRPHNNVWLHHHRKVTIDSDNNIEGWTNTWEAGRWVADGGHPVMMFGTSEQGTEDPLTGKPFLSWSQGVLQPVGEIRTVDAYLEKTWYHACIERNEREFVLTTSGRFRRGGEQTYVAHIPVDRVALTDANSPDYFLFGDPHNNYYRGSVLYDDVTLEVWQGRP